MPYKLSWESAESNDLGGATFEPWVRRLSSGAVGSRLKGRCSPFARGPILNSSQKTIYH